MGIDVGLAGQQAGDESGLVQPGQNKGVGGLKIMGRLGQIGAGCLAVVPRQALGQQGDAVRQHTLTPAFIHHLGGDLAAQQFLKNEKRHQRGHEQQPQHQHVFSGQDR